VIYLVIGICVLSVIVFLSMCVSGKGEDEYRRELVEEMKRDR
jgi:uncharacterized membrane protein YuzA (DUF378 family)